MSALAKVVIGLLFVAALVWRYRRERRELEQLYGSQSLRHQGISSNLTIVTNRTGEYLRVHREIEAESQP